MRLLYIDDDRINTLLFVEACRFAGGLEIESAGTGAEALELVEGWRPDVLVIDLHLPDTSGYELLARLRVQLKAPRLAAYLCTADGAPFVRETARNAGFDGCWIKPMDLKAVLAELASCYRLPELDA
jgi:CheY-like chemotaxis protein